MEERIIQALDPDYETVPDGTFIPKWYVLRRTCNNSREVVALFDKDSGEDMLRLIAADPKDLFIIPTDY